MQVEIRPATLRDLCFTAANAREIDKREIMASGPRTMAECGAVTWYLIEQFGGVGFCVWVDGNPEFSFGFTPQSQLQPWLWSAWAWGSKKTGLCMPEICRWGEKNLIPLVDRLGIVRCEARSIHDHHQAHRWLEWMRFRRETEMPGWGRDGEKFILFAWVRAEFALGGFGGIAGNALLVEGKKDG